MAGNLVNADRPYLHKTAKTFVKNAARYDIGDFKEENRDRLFKEPLELLEELKKTARKREEAFYAAFSTKDLKIKSAEDWERHFLASSKNDATPQQKVLAIINSHEMKNLFNSEITETEALSVFRGIPDKDLKKLGEVFEKNARPQLEKVLQEGTLSEIYKALYFGGIKYKKGYSQRVGQNKVYDIFEKDKKFKRTNKSNTGTLKSEKSRILQGALNRRLKKPKKEIAKASKNYLEEQVKKLSDYKSKQEIYDSLCREWNKAIDEGLKKKRSMFSDSYVLNVGELGENAEEISFVADFIKDINNTWGGSLFKEVRNNATNKVKRFDSNEEVSSKIDLEFILKDNKGKFNIQQKNSDRDIAQELEKEMGLTNGRTQISIHSGISYNTLRHQITQMKAEHASAASRQETFDRLSYLLVNLNILNKNEWAQKRYTLNENDELVKLKGKDKLGKAFKNSNANSTMILKNTQQVINALIEQYFILFIADFEKGEGGLTVSPYDFIIFDSRILIPISEVYGMIINHIRSLSENVEEQIDHLSVTSSITKGFEESDYKEMIRQKLIAVKGEGGFQTEKEGEEYHNGNLVKAGTDAGAKALDHIRFSGFKLDIDLTRFLDTKNLVKR